MGDDGRLSVQPLYAWGRLQRALETSCTHPDPQVRARAVARADRWREVLEGLGTGRLTPGSRAPIADTPAWVTPEVVHGGFATGRLVAEAPLRDDERELLERLGAPPAADSREALNLVLLTDDGLKVLAEALATGTYRIDVPEDAALLVVVWLLEKGREAEAIALVDTLRPWFGRLRLSPRLVDRPEPASALVRLHSAAEVASSLRAARPRPQIAAMYRTVLTWTPLYDRLVALWAETVEGKLPTLDAEGAVQGGWPCSRWPEGWWARRQAWLHDHAEAEKGGRAGRHAHPRSNYQRLLRALQACEGPEGLPPRAAGWVRRALANTVTRRGAPDSPERSAIRASQAKALSKAPHAELRQVVARRLEALPPEQGIAAVEPFLQPVEADEDAVLQGQAIPPHLEPKVARALEAPVDKLVEAGVVTSSEVLAQVLPQLTRQVLAAGIEDPALRDLFSRLYAAFRRRRSLLLLNLERQVRLEELPWVAALGEARSASLGSRKAARQTLEDATLLALASFPGTLLPNPLVRELAALARAARLKLPLVEEVAADIFMGTFTEKWVSAARQASQVLEGSLYARYYDLPPTASWDDEGLTPSTWRRVRNQIARGDRPRSPAERFAALCRERAAEAQGGSGRGVAYNGTLLEQSQILTTHNLASLLAALDLRARLAPLAPDLARKALQESAGLVAAAPPDTHAALRCVKNAAYAWRQGIFFLSLCAPATQWAVLADLGQRLRGSAMRPAVDGLAHVLGGGRFGPQGVAPGARRFLGWSVGPHWLLARR